MGKRENFTADRVAGFKCEPDRQQSIYWDGKTPGLGLRVTASGAKSYVFETRLHGKTLRMTIGSPDAWPLETQWRKDKETGERVEHCRGAREEAQRLKVLTDQGIDPRQQEADKRAKAEAANAEVRRRGLTLGQVWPVYLNARKSKWSERHYEDHVRLASAGGVAKKRGEGLTAAGPLAPLMSARLSELTGLRIAEWMESQTATRPTKAAQSYRLLRAFMRWSADVPEYQGIVPMDAYKARVVKDAVPKVQAKDGDCLQREQLPVWFGAVRKIGNPVVSAYLQALLLTGARREEMAGLRWDDVDFQWGSLTIRDKVESLRTIPLTPYLSQVLRELKARNDSPPAPTRILRGKIIKNDLRNWKPSPWVFSSRNASTGRLTDAGNAHKRVLEAAGLPHVSLHGLRRSFGTLSEWVECPVGVVAQIMGHKPSAIAEKHYRRRPLDLLRMWHCKIEDWMLEQAGIDFDPEQVSPALRVVA